MKKISTVVKEDLWHTPDGYQRTSKKLQRVYLEKLLDRMPISGRILDVGCGTGNSLDILDLTKVDKYLGVDISNAMIRFASERFPDYSDSFIQKDFLSIDKDSLGLFDHAVCAACLHWFHPDQKSVISSIYDLLKDGGYLHLSTALSFEFIPSEEGAQEEVLKEVRRKYSPVREIDTFSSRRATRETIADMLKPFTLMSISQHEEKLSFESFDDFKDWHVGSGSVIAKQFSPEVQSLATDLYYKLLFSRYERGEYEVAYATALINAQK